MNTREDRQTIVHALEGARALIVQELGEQAYQFDGTFIDPATRPEIAAIDRALSLLAAEGGQCTVSEPERRTACACVRNRGTFGE